MEFRLIDYIHELEILTLSAGKQLPVMREDVQHLLQPKEKGE